MTISYTSFGAEQAESAVTIGNFDGVHLGHKLLIDTLCQRAREHDLITTAITFRKTPGDYFSLLNNTTPPIKILTIDDKINLLHHAGIDRVIVIDFDQQLQVMSAHDFFSTIIIDLCQARSLVLGHDFHFGNNRQGNIDLLNQLGAAADCHVHAMELMALGDSKVSSSAIRQHLADNNLDACNQQLGYNYFIQGTIIHGDGRGAAIGFATANIQPELPLQLSGVYATTTQLADGRRIQGATNIGTRPTFEGQQRSCETHLFDFNEDIYNQTITLSFCRKIRDERRFDSVEQLVAQIQQDTDQARNYFTGTTQ